MHSPMSLQGWISWAVFLAAMAARPGAALAEPSPPAASPPAASPPAASPPGQAAAAGAPIDGWRAAFVPEQIAAHHRPASIAVLTGGERGGEPGAAALAATRALAAAYRGAGIRLVLEGDGLGDLAKLDDPAIVARAAALPVEVIAVVRVFSDGERWRAVVSVFDKAGALVTAYTAIAGVPVRSPEAQSGPSQGVSSRAIEALLKDREDKGQDPAQREYLRQSVTTAWMGSSRRSARTSPIFFIGDGSAKRQVEGVEFYRKVERDDLARRYRRRKISGWTSVALGAGMMLVSVGMLSEEECHDYEFIDPERLECFERKEEERGAALVVGLLGTAAASFGLYFVWNPDPVDAVARHHLAEEYNGRLRRSLGLPEDTGESDAKPKAAQASLSLGLAPFVTQGGGGVDVQLRF